MKEKFIFIGILALASLITSGVWYAIEHTMTGCIFYGIGIALVLYLACCEVGGRE